MTARVSSSGCPNLLPTESQDAKPSSSSTGACDLEVTPSEASTSHDIVHTLSSDSEEALQPAQPIGATTPPLTRCASHSGATGHRLVLELAKWVPGRLGGIADECGLHRYAWEQWEIGVNAFYDRPFAGIFNFIYDVLQLSSGRDKFCALMQGYAKFASAALSEKDSEKYWMYRGIEDSLSDGRKIFRLFKEFREVYKVRRGFYRLIEGVFESGVVSIPATCGALDVLGHTASFLYYLFDNLLWAASVGIVRSKEVPKWQRSMWQGLRRNGYVIEQLGGVSSVKRNKNYASIWRLVFASTANVLLLRKAVETSRRVRAGGFQGPDDPRLFHTIELVGMAASFRILLSKLGFARGSHALLGLLAVLASVCGIWTNWRKVVRKKCGAKDFRGAANLRRSTSAGQMT